MSRALFLSSLSRVAMLAALATTVGACSTNPATGQSIFTGLMSPTQEQQVGDEQNSAIIAQYGGAIENARINQFVNDIGQKLVPYTERTDVARYSFTVLDTDDVNAFALPGGYVYITRGLLNLAQNEAQVAGVLAHELAHIQARHSAQQYSQGALANLGVGLLGAVIGGSGGQMASQAAGLGAQAGLMKYSRTHEFEADTLGIRYMQKAGYEPSAAAAFLEMLARNTQFESSIKGAGNSANAFSLMASHPQTTDRIQQAYQIAAQYPQAQYTLGRDRYLNAIDGMNYGGSAKSGFVRGNEFIHPDMGFRFSVPNGFEITNGAKNVIADNGKGALIVFDTGRGQNNNAAQYLTQTWLQGRQIGQVENITVNGLSGAAAQVPQVSINNTPKDAQFVALSDGNGVFYRLMYLTPTGQQANYAADYRRSTYSFAKMTQADKNQYKPHTIRVVSVQAGDTPQSLANRMSIKDHALDRFSLLNGITPQTKLNTGDKVKLILSQ
jgi:predicted Zn-dependent protease